MNLKKIALVILLLLLVSCKKEEPYEYIKEVEIIETDETEEFIFKKDYKEIYKNNRLINDDYRGNLEFESGLIDIEFVKGIDNNQYLRTDWKTLEYSPMGSVFMDYESNIDSQNIILYGHRVGEDFMEGGDKMFFTPLKELIDQENYEENKIIYLALKDELRIYEVASVFYCNLYLEDGYYYPDNDLLYYYAEYDYDYFKSYVDNIKEAEFYDTGVELSYDDKLLTLQTCVYQRNDLRLIVIAKEIDHIPYK